MTRLKEILDVDDAIKNSIKLIKVLKRKSDN